MGRGRPNQHNSGELQHIERSTVPQEPQSLRNAQHYLTIEISDLDDIHSTSPWTHEEHSGIDEQSNGRPQNSENSLLLARWDFLG
ncbi:hypothetical protein R1flu_023085 [Riccia fluitans]|uniref:Uncharacterized protein n=1 Tax=Riccia fluitans TaxID=41844 RepID=A0ABD1XR12_9MARC